MKIGIVIPCFKVRKHICQVVESLLMRSDVYHVIVVDDACPEGSGDLVRETFTGQRVTVSSHLRNQGVGGATMTGYLAAIDAGCDVLVKMDGDGQMDPKALPFLVSPILKGMADYTKGNRFFSTRTLMKMPKVRLLGNAGLSLMSKISSGYWNVIDPTNGYTAIHARVLNLIPFEKVNRRYFFESDLLFRLGLVKAVVRDVPIQSRYGDEESNLSIWKTLASFPLLHLQCFIKRIIYSYFIREFNAGSLQLVLAMLLMLGGGVLGGWEWVSHARQGIVASSGTVMLAGLPIIFGFQLLLAFLLFDLNSVPKEPIHPLLPDQSSVSVGADRKSTV